MSAVELIQAGRPQDCLQTLQEEVKADPSDPKLRVFLFQVLAILGQWDRALTQLKVVGDMDPETLPMVQTYHDVIHCERHREAVFAGERSPLILGEPEKWLAELVTAVGSFAQGDYATFARQRDAALEEAPASDGRIDGHAFEWLADADPRFGPVFEVYMNRAYYWLPMDRVRSIKSEAPSDLRDLVWLPAEIMLRNGGEHVAMMPVRYPRLEGVDAADMMARRTDWLSHDEGVEEGVGQRLLATDENDYAFLDARAIEFAD